VGECLGQVQTHMRLQFQPHRAPVRAVDSITASSTRCSCNQSNSRCNALGMVANRRRSGFFSGVFASTTTTISTFLVYLNPRDLHRFLLGVEAAERAQKRLHTVTCYHPPCRDG